VPSAIEVPCYWLRFQGRIIMNALMRHGLALSEPGLVTSDVPFQQISELLPVKGIDIVGPLPPGAPRVTFFGAGIPVTAKNPEAAKRLIQWLASPTAYAAIHKSGLEPAKSNLYNRPVP
jgi:ABC-type glycerol-3-phosphate transport system substrate-binding protein